MDKLKEKYGDDKQKHERGGDGALQKHGINPLGGCLPMLIQMPIYIALYSMLGNSVELYRSAFLWMHDLTAPDPLLRPAALDRRAMFVQQRSRRRRPTTQQKTMMYMMPLMFTGVQPVLPGGPDDLYSHQHPFDADATWWLNRGEPRKKRGADADAGQGLIPKRPSTIETDEAKWRKRKRLRCSEAARRDGRRAEVAASEDEERITLEVKGAETGLVIGKKGADARRAPVPRSTRSSRRARPRTDGKPINVDAEGYRERRAESLVELAHRLAEKARTTGRPVEADPMSPADRRIIHVALAESRRLTTRSEGEGIYRHLVVIPTGAATVAAQSNSVARDHRARSRPAIGGGDRDRAALGAARRSDRRGEWCGRGRTRPPSHKLHSATLRSRDSASVLDEVLAVVMRAPRSYTGEDVAEIHGHGGARCCSGCSTAMPAAGARMAQPGEFTRRAFEAGRIDLRAPRRWPS